MTSFYIDSADRAVVEPLLQTGLLAGITTNPTLLQASGVRNDDIPHLVRWAVEAGARTVFVQACGDDTAELEKRGRELRAIDQRVEVKLPVTAPGLAAGARLEADGVGARDGRLFGLRILVASLRSPVDAQRLAELGVPEFTLSPAVWRQFFADTLTEDAVAVFNQASSAGSSR